MKKGIGRYLFRRKGLASLGSIVPDYWYDGTDSSFMTLNGSNEVENITDKGSGGYVLTNSGTPKPVFNNKIEFRVGGTLIRNSSNWMSDGADWKLYVVFDLINTTRGYLWRNADTANDRIGMLYDGSDNLIVQKYVSSIENVSLASYTPIGKSFVIITHDSGVMSAKVDGMVMGGSAGPGTSGTIRTMFNSTTWGVTSEGLDWDLYDFLYKENVTSEEDTIIQNYLQDKHNIQPL